MLHIEWIMSEKEDLKAFRAALVNEIKTKLGNGFSFTESHLVLALDLGQIYSYRDMQHALRLFEGALVKNSLHGIIINVVFRH